MKTNLIFVIWIILAILCVYFSINKQEGLAAFFGIIWFLIFVFAGGLGGGGPNNDRIGPSGS